MPDLPTRDNGLQFLKAFQDQFVQVRADDGTLLGCIPTFPEDINVLRCGAQGDGPSVEVGWLATRAVVVPFNQGIDPSTLVGFIPAGNYQSGVLQTGFTGQALPPARPRSQRPPGDMTQGFQGDAEEV